MSTENHFLQWLNRTDKTFCENLKFALNAWNSSEFTLSSKYEIILNWVVTEGSTQKQLPENEINEILNQRVQPALITQSAKQKFIKMLLNDAGHSNCYKKTFAELLCKLLGVEWLQDLLRSNQNLMLSVYAALLNCYENFLKAESASNEVKLIAEESEFTSRVIKLLKNHLKSIEYKPVNLQDLYGTLITPLTQVLLILRNRYNINFFDELREIEMLAQGEIELLLKLPAHSGLIMLESAVANRRLEQGFLVTMIESVFPDCTNFDQNLDVDLLLIKAAYVLDILRKHNIPLNFQFTETNPTKMVGERIFEYTCLFRETNLNSVLLLLCAALRLNPLILEEHVFEITTWMIVIPKATENTAKTMELFEEYLILLLEMFRRLSRTEKFAVNLLKALNKWLNENQLQPLVSPKKLHKRKLNQSITTPPKRIKKDNDSSNTATLNSYDNFYIEMLFEDYNKQNKSGRQLETSCCMDDSFICLQSAWPSSTVGVAFSRLITNLVSKASITIWKTLLFAFKEQLEILEKDPSAVNNENALFLLDMHAALLCEYFVGAKLSEQYEKYVKEVAQLRKFTHEVLSTFGNFIMEQPYNKRTVNAFLECCFYAANFELLLAYYKPDGLVDETLDAKVLVPQLHDFLTMNAWSSLEKRILNEGKRKCQTLYDRLVLQRVEAEQLLNVESKEFSTCKEPEKMAQYLSVTKPPNAKWFIDQLSRTEKTLLMKFKCQQSELENLVSDRFLEHASKNAEALELLAYAIFEEVQKTFLTNGSKGSLLMSLNCDFDAVRQCSPQDHQSFDKIIKNVVGVIKARDINYKIKNLNLEYVESVLKLLRKLPLGYLRRQAKSLIFAFCVALYRDLKMTQVELEENAEVKTKELIGYITDFLHFGPQVPIFRYFDMSKILEILPIADCWEFYKFLFSTIKNDEKGTEEFLVSLEKLLQNTLEATNNFSNEETRLLLIAIETLSSLNGLIARKMSKHLLSLLSIYGDFIYTHFDKETNTKKDKKFVESTLAGFAPFLKSVLVAANNKKISKDKEHQDTKEDSKEMKPLDENFRRICKIYIGYSLNYRNPHAIRLVQAALNNRQSLHLDQDEIELVLSGFWRQLIADIQSQDQNPLAALNNQDCDGEDIFSLTTTTTDAKNLETLVKMIIDNKTNEDLLLTLKDIGSNLSNECSFKNVIEMLSLIAKSTFSTIKGAIFNEQFKQITNNVILQLECNEQQQQQRFTNIEIVLKILNCQEIFVNNKTISIAPDSLDSILSFLVQINLKRYHISDTNTSEFFKLHAAMTSLCSSLIKQRHVLLMDRIPHIMHIFKDLLQSIVHYKSERQKDTPLSTAELDELSELALKLEVLMSSIAGHSVDVKRVAPFVLIFAINLMVFCKRPTTLYPKIKTHVEAICYSLIGICDHRVGRFILRCSNEAARQTYESLVKDHKKYHKFKGKV